MLKVLQITGVLVAIFVNISLFSTSIHLKSDQFGLILSFYYIVVSWYSIDVVLVKS